MTVYLLEIYKKGQCPVYAILSDLTTLHEPVVHDSWGWDELFALSFVTMDPALVFFSICVKSSTQLGLLTYQLTARHVLKYQVIK